MPLELVVESPKKAAFVEYEDRDPVGDEVLVQTTVSGIKHGTEINGYQLSPAGHATREPRRCVRGGARLPCWQWWLGG